MIQKAAAKVIPSAFHPLEDDPPAYRPTMEGIGVYLSGLGSPGPKGSSIIHGCLLTLSSSIVRSELPVRSTRTVREFYNRALVTFEIARNPRLAQYLHWTQYREK